MKQNILSAVKFLVFLGLGVTLTWLAVKDIPEDQVPVIIDAILNANYFWVGLSMLTGLIAHWSRAVRWKMFYAPMGYTPKTTNTFYALMVGYLGNLAINRLGEVLRCTVLKRYENIPLTQSFGTVIAERVIDMFILCLIFVISIWAEYEKLQNLVAEKVMPRLNTKLLLITDNKIFLITATALGLFLIMVAFLLRKKIFQSTLSKKVGGVALGFWEGMRAVSKMKNPWLFVFHSIFIWMMYLVAVYTCVFAFEETKIITPVDCLVIMAFGSIGVIASPGGIGLYQIIVQRILMTLYPIFVFIDADGPHAASYAIAFAWTAWLAQFAVVLIFGVLSFGLLALGNKEKPLSDISK